MTSSLDAIAAEQEAAKRNLWLHFTRMSTYADSDVPVIVRGSGAYVYDQHGKRYLDGLSGLFVSQVGQPLRELDGLGMGVGPQREVREFGRLPRACFGDFLSAMADLADEQAGQPVQVPSAMLVVDVGA